MDSLMFLAKLCPSLPIILEVFMTSGVACLAAVVMNSYTYRPALAVG